MHIDVKKLGTIGRPGHRVNADRRTRSRGIGWEFVHVAVDDATRLAYVEVLRDEKAPTVESGIPSVSAISGLVKRSSRSDRISSSRSAGVRDGTETGAEERSSSPRSPSRRKRSTHFQAVRPLTPAASAAAANDQPSTNTRSASSRLERGHVLAFLCNVTVRPPWSR